MDFNQIMEEIQENFNSFIGKVPSGSFDIALESVGNVSTIAGAISTIREVYDQILFYKMGKLYNDIRNNIENRKDKDIIIEKIKSNTKERIRQTNLLLMVLEQETVEEKIEYYANLTVLFLAEEITVDNFELYVEMVKDLYTQDIQGLFEMYENHKGLEEFRNLDIDPITSRIAGFGYSLDLRQMKRINRTGLLNEISSQRLGNLGRPDSYEITNQAIHFICSIKGDLTEYLNMTPIK